MKKIVFLGLALLLVASSTGFSQNIPLPKDIENLPGAGAWITLEMQQDLKTLKAIYEGPKRKIDGTLGKIE